MSSPASGSQRRWASRRSRSGSDARLVPSRIPGVTVSARSSGDQPRPWLARRPDWVTPSLKKSRPSLGWRWQRTSSARQPSRFSERGTRGLAPWGVRSSGGGISWARTVASPFGRMRIAVRAAQMGSLPRLARRVRHRASKA